MLVDWWFIYILGVHVTCNMNVFKNLMSPSPFPPFPLLSLPLVFLPPSSPLSFAAGQFFMTVSVSVRLN